MLGGWLLAVVVLAPILTQPLIAIGLVLMIAVAALAWRSIAYPLGLGGLPTVITGVVGHNPLPKGGTTFLFAAWIAGALIIALVRRDSSAGVRGLFTLPVAMTLALLALMMLRLGPSADQSYGMQKIELFVANNVILMIGAVFLGTDRKALRLFFVLVLAITALESVVLIANILSGGSQAFAGRYAVSAQAGPIYLGRDGATGALIAMYLVLSTGPGRLRRAVYVALPLCLIALIAAGSRGPVVAFVTSMVALLALSAASPQARRRLVILLVVVLAATIVVPFVVPASSIGRALSTIVGSSSGLSSNGRSSLWAQAYIVLGQHTLVGIGTGGFGALNLGYPYPHNILLEVTLELGAVGLIVFGTMVTSLTVRLSRLWRETEPVQRLEVSLLIALFLGACVNACFSGALPDNSDVWRWGGVALGMYARRELMLPRASRRSWATT